MLTWVDSSNILADGYDDCERVATVFLTTNKKYRLQLFGHSYAFKRIGDYPDLDSAKAVAEVMHGMGVCDE